MYGIYILCQGTYWPIKKAAMSTDVAVIAAVDGFIERVVGVYVCLDTLQYWRGVVPSSAGVVLH